MFSFHSIKPAVNKKILIFISGFLWLCVGIMLNNFALHWLKNYSLLTIILCLLPGLIAALIISYYGFLKIVDKNLGRISLLNDYACVFAFMTWKSYILVAIMIYTGVFLRHSSMPKQYLSIIYIAIGSALIFSSLRYFYNFFTNINKF